METMIPGVNLINVIEYVGVLGVAIMIFAESGLLIGFFLPGDSLLFTAGFLVFAGFLHINIYLLVAIVFIAAAAGDTVGYTFGKRVGGRLFNRPNSRLFKQGNVKRAEKFYQTYGSKTIIFARFIPIVRTFAPIVAGIGNMRYRTFITYNLIGGFLWSAAVTLLGYFVGSWFEKMGISIDRVILPIILVILFLSILPPLIHVLRDNEQRRAVFDSAIKQLQIIFRRKR
jgi:membrane-associated protein